VKIPTIITSRSLTDMAFINEAIATAEQIAEFKSFGFISPLTKRPHEPQRWAVDRVRQLYFVSFGGGISELPYFFALIQKGGAVISIRGVNRTKGGADRRVKVWWTLDEVHVVGGNSIPPRQVVEWIREAFEAFGYLGRPERTKAVHVSIPAPEFA
jgi:hypothetical protein